MKTFIALIIAVVLLESRVLPQEPSLKVVSVCDLLTHSSEYNHKRVAVRGEYFVGGHGLYLRGVGCGSSIVTDGYQWPMNIFISVQEDEMQKRGVSFAQLQKVLNDVGTTIARERARSAQDANVPIIIVTLVGLFETHDRFDTQIARRPNGELMVNGFGPLASASGQMFVELAQDVAVQ